MKQIQEDVSQQGLCETYLCAETTLNQINGIHGH
jgi:hypothetical protein